MSTISTPHPAATDDDPLHEPVGPGAAAQPTAASAARRRQAVVYRCMPETEPEAWS